MKKGWATPASPQPKIRPPAKTLPSCRSSWLTVTGSASRRDVRGLEEAGDELAQAGALGPLRDQPLVQRGQRGGPTVECAELKQFLRERNGRELQLGVASKQLPETVVYQYVTAVLDLATVEDTLRVLREGEILATVSITIRPR